MTTCRISDFENLLSGLTGSCTTWECGNFNGDASVDITDFVLFLGPFVASSAREGTYAPSQSIPEPSALLLLGLSGALLAHILGRDSLATQI